jgi:hypothetical protein
MDTHTLWTGSTLVLDLKEVFGLEALKGSRSLGKASDGVWSASSLSKLSPSKGRVFNRLFHFQEGCAGPPAGETWYVDST